MKTKTGTRRGTMGSSTHSLTAGAEPGKALTIWWCEHCHASGFNNLAEFDVYSAVAQLEAGHDGHPLARLQSCRFALGRVRVTEHQS